MEITTKQSETLREVYAIPAGRLLRLNSDDKFYIKLRGDTFTGNAHVGERALVCVMTGLIVFVSSDSLATSYSNAQIIAGDPDA